jgi:DNA (cytosine-5)-methyltransferase 1
MRHASLFSGIGGFDLAAEWMGWENIFHCDINPFGKKVLEYYYPKSISYGDITKTDFTIHRGDIDILTGGFPCQPYSLAGKRKGKEDERHLWPQMLRAIREIQPRWIIGENVYGLVNWDGGLVFHEVQSDLEAEGYEVFPYVLPACSIGAVHRRDRVFFIAYSKSIRSTISKLGKSQSKQQIQTRCDIDRFESMGITTNSNNFRCNECNGEYAEQSVNGGINALNDTCQMSTSESITDSECVRLEYGKEARDIPEGEGKTQSKRSKSSESFETNGTKWNATDSDGIRLRRESDRIRESGFTCENEQRNYWENFPTVSPICNGDDGISDRLDSITFSKWRKQSIMAGGNAVVPQLIYVLFKTISKFEQLKSKQ